MFLRTLRFCYVPVLVLLLTCFATGQNQTQQFNEIKSAVAHLPIVFEPNVGQAAEAVKFSARGSGYALFLTNEEMVAAARGDHGGQRALKMRLVGAKVAPEMTGEEKLPGRSSYVRGNDPSRWRQGIEQYAAVRIREVYEGIDVRYYGSGGRLEHDYIVSAGADASRVRMKFEDTTGLNVDERGNLLVRVGDEDFVMERPIAYQEVAGRRTEIASRYEIGRDNTVGFALGAYDNARELVIDPVLQYATYLGGIGYDDVASVATDAAGNMYVYGSSNSVDFPIAGANARAHPGGTGWLLYLAKLNPTLSTLVYSTFIGGTNYQDAGKLVVDSEGNATITGSTQSRDYPQLNPVGACDYYNGIVTKFAADGAMVFSSCLGKSTSGAAYDAVGNVYIAGHGVNITASSDAFQPVNPSGQIDSGFVVLLSPSGQLTRATYLGGSSYESDLNGVRVRADGTVAVAGQTTSRDFPVTAGSYNTTPLDTGSGFVAVLNGSLSELKAATYAPQGSFTFDPSGNAIVGSRYMTGTTVTAGAVDTNCYYLSCIYLTKISADLKAKQWVARIGTSGSAPGLSSLRSDESGNVWLSAYTDNRWPLMKPVVQGFEVTGQQALAEISADGRELLFSSHMATEYGVLGVGATGSVYVAGRVGGQDWTRMNPPTTEGALQQSIAGKADVYVAKLDLKSPYGTACFDANIINFGMVRAGTTSLPIVRTLTNCGTGPLHVSGMTTDDPEFTLTQNCGTLAPGESCTISVLFHPTDGYDKRSELSIDSDSLMKRSTVLLFGSGTAPSIFIMVPKFEFGSVLTGNTKSTEIWVSNRGRAYLRMRGAKVTGPFSVTGDCIGTGIDWDSSCVVTVKASPTNNLLF